MTTPADPLDDGVAETQRRHSENCRRQEAQRQREAEILQAGYELGRTPADPRAREPQELSADGYKRHCSACYAAEKTLDENDAPTGDGMGRFTLAGRLQAYINNMADQLATVTRERDSARLLPSVEHCQVERAEGNGGCGACALCCKEQRERAEKAEAEVDRLSAQLAKAKQEQP